MAPPDAPEAGARRRVLARLLAIAASPLALRDAGARESLVAETEVAALLDSVATLPRDSTAGLAARIERLSFALLGRAYRLDPLGEGAGGVVDRDPLWRLDAFDCLSLVETVLALARADSAGDFAANLVRIRYRRGDISFGARNHFMEADWLPANIEHGVLADISRTLPAPQAVARGQLTRRRWLEALQSNPLHARNGDMQSAAAREELRRLAALAPAAEPVSLDYARLRELEPTALSAVVAAIPAGSVLLIIRPNTSLFGAVGAVTQVSHLGFVARGAGQPVFRHASSRRRRPGVIDVPLLGYLREMQQTRSFTGIKVLQVIAENRSSLP